MTTNRAGTTSTTPADQFEPPGPGGWKRLADHFPRALTPEYQRIYAATCPQGMAAYMARYGVLARTIDVAFVQGHLYITPVPIAGPREMRRPPPAAAMWLLSRVHPEFRRRARAARRALAQRPWHAAAGHWFSVERRQWVERNGAVQQIDLAALTTGMLVDHLRACQELVTHGYRRHFELHGDDLLPIGLLLVRTREWGVDACTALAALQGASTSAISAPAEWQLVTGYDLDSAAWIEMADHPAPRATGASCPTDLAPLVATQHHTELARLIDDARAAVPLRDDNGAITGAWPMGLLRRAMLEAGRRLGLADPTLAVEATVDELVDGLGAARELTADDLMLRRADRERRSRLDAPTALGPEFAIPPLSALPVPLALMGGAQVAVADHMISPVGSGIGIGTRTYTGRALVVDDPATAFELMEPGDVVVTSATCPSWNAILTTVGALVTTTGGLVSHAAIIARELDIPAIIGDTTAIARTSTGDLVTVDPCHARFTLDAKAPSIGKPLRPDTPTTTPSTPPHSR